MARILLMAALALAPTAALAAQGADGWVDLFNGKDLTGWANQGGNWRVVEEDGKPTLECFKGGGSLTYEKAYGDCVLDLWFRLPPGQNSGVFFRGSRIVPGGYPPPGSSYEVQLYDRKEMWGHRTGDLLYPHRARRWASRPNQWNHMTIISLGRHHKGILNGQTIFDVIDTGSTPEKGYIALQAHGGTVYFRQVRVREITDGRWPEDTGRLKAMLFVGESRGMGKRVDVHGALIEQFLDDSARFEVTWSPEELALDPQYLGKCDLAILYDNRPDLSAKAQKQLADFVRAGGGLLVLNRSAVGTFKTWEAFAEISDVSQTAGTWTGVEDIEVRVGDSNHPVAAGVRPFRVRDTRCKGIRLLLAQAPVLQTSGDDAEPLAWASTFGKGKVFFCLLGEEQDTLRNPDFQRLVVSAATWAALPEPPAAVQKLMAAKDAAGLAKLLHEPSTRADLAVVQALASVGTAPAAAALSNVASRPGELLVRVAAADALGRVSEGGLEALHRLLKFAEPGRVRAAAAEAVAAHAAPASAAPLAKALGDPNELVREKALAALGHIKSPEAEAAILAKLTGDDPAWYPGALAALGRADSDRARKALVAVARGRDARYQGVLPGVAAALAAQMKHAEVFDAMVALLDAPARDARTAAAQALAASGDPRIAKLFLPRVFGSDADVGRIAEEHLRKAGDGALDKLIGPFIRQWLVIGPFPNQGNRGFKMDYAPEKEIKLDADYEAVGGVAKWKRVTADADTVNLAKVFPKHNQNVVAYAFVVIECPSARDVQLRTGSDDGIAGWLNGKRILSVDRPRGVAIDEDRTAIHLRKGQNRLLLKIAQGGGDWGFVARLADPKGNLAGLKTLIPESDLDLE